MSTAVMSTAPMFECSEHLFKVDCPRINFFYYDSRRSAIIFARSACRSRVCFKVKRRIREYLFNESDFRGKAGDKKKTKQIQRAGRT